MTHHQVRRALLTRGRIFSTQKKSGSSGLWGHHVFARIRAKVTLSSIPPTPCCNGGWTSANCCALSLRMGNALWLFILASLTTLYLPQPSPEKVRPGPVQDFLQAPTPGPREEGYSHGGPPIPYRYRFDFGWVAECLRIMRCMT